MSVRVRVPGAVALGERVVLPASEAHHLTVVLRRRAGDRVEVLDSDGTRWMGRLTADEPAQVQVESLCDGASADPEVGLHLWIPLLKGGRTADLIRQLTELGATEVSVFSSKNSVARLTGPKVEKRLDRWRTIADEATKQCGRGAPPRVSWSAALPTTAVPSGGGSVVFWERPGPLAREAFAGPKPVQILVGPEGGLAPEEVASLQALGWQAAWLGPRILRAETAVLAATVLGLSALEEGGY